MSVMTLSRDKWKKFKEANELSKSSFFNKTNVGPHIAAFKRRWRQARKVRTEEPDDLLHQGRRFEKGLPEIHCSQGNERRIEGPGESQLEGMEQGARVGRPRPGKTE